MIYGNRDVADIISVTNKMNLRYRDDPGGSNLYELFKSRYFSLGGCRRVDQIV